MGAAPLGPLPECGRRTESVAGVKKVGGPERTGIGVPLTEGCGCGAQLPTELRCPSTTPPCDSEPITQSMLWPPTESTALEGVCIGRFSRWVRPIPALPAALPPSDPPSGPLRAGSCAVWPSPTEECGDKRGRGVPATEPPIWTGRGRGVPGTEPLIWTAKSGDSNSSLGPSPPTAAPLPFPPPMAATPPSPGEGRGPSAASSASEEAEDKLRGADGGGSVEG